MYRKFGSSYTVLVQALKIHFFPADVTWMLMFFKSLCGAPGDHECCRVTQHNYKLVYCVLYIITVALFQELQVWKFQFLLVKYRKLIVLFSVSHVLFPITLSGAWFGDKKDLDQFTDVSTTAWFSCLPYIYIQPSWISNASRLLFKEIIAPAEC